MFSIPHRRFKSDRPAEQSKALLDAICQGRTAEEKQRLGATICPWALSFDASTFRESRRGPLSALAHFNPMAATVAKHGDLDLFKGHLRHPVFFGESPHIENSDRNGYEHKDRDLTMACALEAAALGRVDLLAALHEACLDHVAARAPDPDGHRRYSQAETSIDRFLEFRGDQAKKLLQWVASSSLDEESILRTYRWIESHVGKKKQGDYDLYYDKPVNLALELLDCACECESPKCAEIAIALGAEPLLSHLDALAGFGALDLAERIAKVAKAPNAKQRDRLEPRFGTPKDERSSICDKMAFSFSRALTDIARGHFERRDDEAWREVTWANFSDYRAHIHAACARALSGAFDSPHDKPELLEKNKDRLASIARALCSLDLPGDAEALSRIQHLRPNAPACAEELLHIAQLGRDELGERLEGAELGEADAFCQKIIKHHLDASKMKPLPGHGSSAISAYESRVKNLFEAIYAISCRESSCMSPSTRESFHAHVAQSGLAMELERRALEEASAMPIKRRGQLKA